MKTQNEPSSSDSKPAASSVLKSAAFMSLATLTSRILGMFRDMVMAALFPKMVSDAYVVAFRLPNLFRRVLGEGSLAASFVPLYIEAKTQDPVESRHFASAVFSMLTVLTSSLSVLGIIFMEPLMGHLVGGESYMQVPGKFELTVFLARIMFSYLFLVTTYAFFMSLANAHKIFFIPALAPAAFNLMTIIMAFLPEWKMPGDQLATGVLLGGVLQLGLTFYPLIKIGVMPKFTWQWSSKRVSRFFRVMLPSMLGMGVAQLLAVMNVFFASHLPQGSHSYIYLADRLLEFPQSLISVSLGVAFLPTLSEMWVNNKREEFLSTIHRHVRLLMVLSVPSAIGLFVLSRPIVEVIYGRGQFNEHDILLTAEVLSIYAFVLVATGLHRVTVPCFYAIKNTWLPAANSAFCIGVHFFVAGWASQKFGLAGLVGATAVTGILNLVILLISFKVIFHNLGSAQFLRSFFWMLPGAALMGWAAPEIYFLMRDFLTPIFDVTLSRILGLSVSITCAAVIFFAVNWILRHPESREVLNLIFKRFKRKA